MKRSSPQPTAPGPVETTLRFLLESGVWLVADPAPVARPVPGAVPEATPLPDPLPAVAGAGGDQAAALARVRADLGDCRRCRLHEGRTEIVFGVGNPAADLLFVGEAPGAEEDRRGEPFVGRAGRLLDHMIGALGLGREQVYIANILKCRPPGNRDPREDEVATCTPFLWRQIDVLRPRVICALGAHAARHLLGADAAISSVRGRPQVRRGWTVLPTYHPAYLLRSPAAKRAAWQDFKVLLDLLRA